MELPARKRKGISLPISAIVVIGLAVFVGAAIALFFLSTGGGQLSKIEAEQIYRTRCQTYCDPSNPGRTLATAAILQQTDPQFITACEIKGIPLRDSRGAVAPLVCIKACPCNLEPTTDGSKCRNDCGLILSGSFGKPSSELQQRYDQCTAQCPV